MWLDDPVNEFEIDPDETSVPEDSRTEPTLVSGPYLVEFDDVAQVDPARAIGEPDEWEEYPEPPPRVKSAGLAGSLGMHLLPLLILLGLTSSAPAELGGAIPVNLVLQPPPPEAPALETQAPPPNEPVPDSPAPPKPVEPPKIRQAAVVPPVKPKPPPVPPQPAPKSSPQSASKNAPQPQPAAPVALSSTGPYLAYLVTLTRQHLDKLPESFVAGRRGKTVIGVRVLDDGTIAQTRVAASSSYPDIDARIQEMVVAVGRFPPLPEALRGQNIELDLNLNFPEVFKP